MKQSAILPLTVLCLVIAASVKGESAPPLKNERPAPAASLVLKGGYADIRDVTLNPDGDWSIFITTLAPTGDSANGPVLSIGTPSDRLFSDKGFLSIIWCNNQGPWDPALFTKSFVVAAKDDAGTEISMRKPRAKSLYGIPDVHPLAGQGSFGDGRAHGLVVQRRAGVVEFWSVDETGALLMDHGSLDKPNFKGLSNKTLRFGGLLMPSQTGANWRQPVQALVLYNGGCMTPLQMSRLFRGADARDVLDLQRARGGRYFPGSLENGALSDLLGGEAGNVTGAAVAGPSILPAAAEDVLVDMDGYGQVLPRERAPATTSKARFWGTRIGGATDIRMRVVEWKAPSKVVVDWATVATGVQNGQDWIGEIPSVPHAFTDYDCEISWKDASGNWTAPKRLHRRWTLGVVAGIGGQSIVQMARDASGTKRSFNPKIAGFLRGYYDINQGSAFLQDNSETQGWLTFQTPTAPKTTGSHFGELRMSEQLALLCDCPVGIGSFAVGGSPISRYLGNSDRWARWKRFVQRNRPQFAIWGNGQGDMAMPRDKRHAALDRLLAQYDEAVRTAPGGPWDYTFYVFPINGNWAESNPDSIRSHDIEWVRSRAAQGKPVALLCVVVDGLTGDGVHLKPDDSGHGPLAARMAQTLAHGMGNAQLTGVGPDFDRANCTWQSKEGKTTIDLRVVLNGGSKIVTAGGGTSTGFQIKLDDGKFTPPIAAAITAPTHLQLVAEGEAAKSVTVTYLAGNPGLKGKRGETTKADARVDNALYDNRGDPIAGLPGFPVMPITSTDPLVLRK